METSRMRLVVIGANQNSAPVATREYLAVTPANLHYTLADLREITAEGFILSTCNRVEVYALVASDKVANLQRWFLRNATDADRHIYTLYDVQAAQHLFRVAAGLDSLVLGEDQILAQVKAALQSAQDADTLGPITHRLGHDALAAGKQVRRETAISRSNLSVVSVALRLAADHFGDLSGRETLILGGGQTAELTLKHLASSKANVTVINRTFQRAADLAERYGVKAQPWAELANSLAKADLLISCTSAAAPVVSAAMLAQALEGRAKPLLALDLAAPRDIEQADLENLTLYDIDSLRAICEENRLKRGGEIQQAEILVAAAVARFMEWQQARVVAPTVTALREHVTAVCEGEVERILSKMPGLSEREQDAIRRLSASIANKLLHTPVAEIKTGTEMAQAAQQLFHLSCDA